MFWRISVRLNVENTLAGDGSEESISLTFRNMNNFTPEQVARQIPRLKAMLPRDFRLAVNLTSALLEREFTQMCLALAGHDSIHLVLELTEQQTFNMDRQTEEKLSRLSDVGVAFALDDFGIDCSVVPYLEHFPASYIKMDKSFTQDILSKKTSRHIVESVVGLPGKLGIDTVAEEVLVESF